MQQSSRFIWIRFVPAKHSQIILIQRFLERTFMTRNLAILASEVLRRLSGETTETSAVFNLATQFGGGKTHALTLLYHLVTNGAKADRWTGVPQLLEKANVLSVPRAVCA